MFACIWLLGIIDTIIFLTPYATVFYVVENYGYDRNLNQSWSGTAVQIEFWYGNVMQATTALLYLLIFGYLIYQVLPFLTQTLFFPLAKNGQNKCHAAEAMSQSRACEGRDKGSIKQEAFRWGIGGLYER
jgi:hypothetical protein